MSELSPMPQPRFNLKDRVVINDNINAPKSILTPGMTGVLHQYANHDYDYILKLDVNSDLYGVFENEIDRLDTPLFSGLQ